jgi:hypothetical protein
VSALKIVKRTDATGFKIPMFCEGGCTPYSVSSGRSKPKQNSACRVVFLAGRPAMGLCLGCSRKLQRLWNEADAGYLEYEREVA